jgi:hypothetical protein
MDGQARLIEVTPNQGRSIAPLHCEGGFIATWKAQLSETQLCPLSRKSKL